MQWYASEQIETAAFLKANDVQIESWGPFAEGKNNMFTNELLRSIGQKHRKSVAQVVLRWLMQRGVVAIPKSVRKERIAGNFNIFDFELSTRTIWRLLQVWTKKPVLSSIIAIQKK